MSKVLGSLMGAGEVCAGQMVRMQGGASVVKSPKLV